MVKTNRSTLHTVNNIQQSATQDSNDTTHRLSRRTAATTIGDGDDNDDCVLMQKNRAPVMNQVNRLDCPARPSS